MGIKWRCSRVQLTFIFSILFLLVGWVAPMSYAAYAPAESFLQVHDFSAEDATVGDTSHAIEMDRTVSQTTTGTVYTELYLIDEDTGHRVRISSEMMERPLVEGRATVTREQEIPEQVKPGSYSYELTIRMELAQGRIFRTFSYESEVFQISP
jgi:hypothetical protein